MFQSNIQRQFVCGIAECELSGWDLLSWGYKCVYVSSHCAEAVHLWYCRMCSLWLRYVELRVWMCVCSTAIQRQFVYLSVILESNACVWECVYVLQQYRGSSSIYLWSQRVMLVRLGCVWSKAIQRQFVYLSVILESNVCVFESVYVSRQYRGSSSIYLWSRTVILVCLRVCMIQGNTEAVRLSICHPRE